MALVPIIQPPIMKLLTTKKERVIVMPEPKEVTQRQRILFPNNYVIMHAMGPILASTIGSAVVAGILISIFR